MSHLKPFKVDIKGKNTVVVLILAAVLFASYFVWSTINEYESLTSLQKKYLKIIELKGIIDQYDEVLTMSARMAAATGELKWELRYRKVEPLLDQAIKESISLQPQGAQMADSTDAANIKLVEMENQAFKLIGANRLSEAMDVLSSPDYEKYKLIYSTGMKDLSHNIYETIENDLSKIQSNAAKSKFLMLMSFLFLAITSVYFLKKLTQSNQNIISLNASLEGKVQEQAQILVQASKMRALGEMSAGIAHEINNPVGIIQGKTQQLKRLLQSEMWTPKKGLEELDKIFYQTDRIAKIVRGLRFFSRCNEKDSPIPVEIQTIIADVVELCGQKFKINNVTLEVNIRSDLTVQGQVVQLGQVILNLLNNSFDAVANLSEKWVRVSAEPIGHRARITVTDSGQGIPAELIDKIMQPFFTTKEVGLGTGLGLSISKGIIEEHNGIFWVDQKSRNTCFIIELPLYLSKKDLKVA
ncbi:MAG: ATP-binding protein [Pseudomonadota bacterium]|nr:ATP-binding protein [Pseudomonadota bacterium]